MGLGLGLLGRAGLCSLGVWNGMALKTARRSVKGCGEYFVISRNFTWLDFQMVWSKKGPVFLSICLGGNGLRIEWTMYYVFSIFGSLGDWNVPGIWI